MTQFHQNLQRREQARIAFIRSDHDLKLRRALLRRARPVRCLANPGQWVMFWREGKGALHGAWHGNARVLMREDPNVVWLSHLSRLYRCAPEHIRDLSSREQEQVTAEQSSQDSPWKSGQGRLGTGVFQYHDLISNKYPFTGNSKLTGCRKPECQSTRTAYSSCNPGRYPNNRAPACG